MQVMAESIDREVSDAALIDAFVTGTAHLTQEQAAAEGGVGQKTVSRWRAGDRSPLRTRTRKALEVWQARQQGALTPDEDEALGVFGSFDEIARQLQGIAPPGQSKARKRDALEGLRRTAADFGWKLPDWWYRLREMVDEDQI